MNEKSSRRIEPLEKEKATEHLNIGEFARRSRLSLKALRLYDAMGLLPPAYVDSQSGYRYYHPEQLERAKLIGLLRQLEMPLNRIAEVLELKGAKAARAIAAYWAEVEIDTRAKRKLVHYLEDYLEGKGEAMYEVLTRHVAEQKVASIQQGVYVKDLSKFISDSMHAIFELFGKNNLQQSGPSFVIYHGQVNEDSAGPVEVCVPFEGSLEPVGRVRIRLEPPHTEAYTRLTKAQVDFPDILKAYDAVNDWLKNHNTHMIDSPREVYFAPWDQLGPDDLACDIAYPYPG